MKRKVSVVLFLSWLGAGCLWGLFGPDQDTSQSERRKLQSAPEFTWKGLFDGSYEEKRELYLADQFLGRELFRTGKAVFDYEILQKQDVHGVYVKEGQAGELLYPLKEAAVSYAGDRVKAVIQKYMMDTDCRIYYSIIPDKTSHLAEQAGFPSVDYDKLRQLFAGKLEESGEEIQGISIWDEMQLDDYYTTDLHWKQEEIAGVAARIAEKMETDAFSKEDLEWKDLGAFYGVYSGQAALPLAPDSLCYGTNQELEMCTVQHPFSGKQDKIYDLVKAQGMDRYDLFLSGAEPLLIITNPSVHNGRRLLLFRDSFGSSLAPYLVKGYEEITLIDLRYFHPDLLGQYVDFTDQDVLFLYYTGLLNQGYLFK